MQWPVCILDLAGVHVVCLSGLWVLDDLRVETPQGAAILLRWLLRRLRSRG
jgi:hypothetical protein